MRNQNSYARQGNAQNAKPVGGAPIASVAGLVLDGSANLQREGARNGAGQIAGSDLLTLLEAHDGEVLLGVAAVSQSRWSWGSPSQNLAELTPERECESGVDIFDGGQADFVPREWVEDYYAFNVKAHSGKNVVGEDSAHNQGHDGDTADSSFGALVEALQACDTTQNQTCNGNDITRGGSFHPEIVARKEQFNGNL